MEFLGGLALAILMFFFFRFLILDQINIEKRRKYEREIRRSQDEYWKNQNNSSLPSSSLDNSKNIEEIANDFLMLLSSHGLFGDEIREAFADCLATLKSERDLFRFISNYEDKNAPSAAFFCKAVRLNYLYLKKQLKKYNVTQSDDVDETVHTIIDNCSDKHAQFFFNLNQRDNMTGVTDYGVVSLNYFMFAYHFYLQALIRSPLFIVNSLSSSMHRSITEIGRRFGVVNEEQSWLDASAWGVLVCRVLEFDFSEEDVEDVSGILDKIVRSLDGEILN